jgi:hypothetical protein
MTKENNAMFTAGYWRQLYGIQNVLEGLIIQDVGERAEMGMTGVPDEPLTAGRVFLVG